MLSSLESELPTALQLLELSQVTRALTRLSIVRGTLNPTTPNNRPIVLAKGRSLISTRLPADEIPSLVDFLKAGNYASGSDNVAKETTSYILERRYMRKVANVTELLSSLDAVVDLGGFYRDQHLPDKAEKMYRHALSGYEKALGSDHKYALMTVHKLGFLYCDQGRLDEAESLYNRALVGYEKISGAYHESTLGTLEDLARLYEDQGHREKAKRMHDRALVGRAKAKALLEEGSSGLRLLLGVALIAAAAT